MKTFAPRLLLLSALLFLVAGCVSNAKLGGLSVKIIEAKALSDGRTELTLEYYNDNLLPVGISTSQHTLTLDGRKQDRISIKEPVGLPRLATGRQTTTVSLTPAPVAGTTLSYRLESALSIDAGDQELRSNTQSSGTVEVK